MQQAERDKMREKCEKIVAHGINCFVNRQLIYNFPEELFADRGIMAIEHADFDGIERLALVTGARSRGAGGGGGGGGGGLPAREAGRQAAWHTRCVLARPWWCHLCPIAQAARLCPPLTTPPTSSLGGAI